MSFFPIPLTSIEPHTRAFESTPLVKPTGFREYDARWFFGEELNLMGVQAVGMGLGTLIRRMGIAPEIVIDICLEHLIENFTVGLLLVKLQAAQTAFAGLEQDITKWRRDDGHISNSMVNEQTQWSIIKYGQPLDN